jgi:hypothetical protein
MMCSPMWKTEGDGRNRRGILGGGRLGFMKVVSLAKIYNFCIGLI